MKVAVIGANGKAGQLIVKEAVDAGFDVTAIVRQNNKSLANNVIVKDLFKLTKEELTSFDVVVNAMGVFVEERMHELSEATTYLCSILKGSKTRYIVVGGAGSLYLNNEHTLMLSEAPNFPDAYQAIAKACFKALSILRTFSDINWTYISPAADFRADAPRTLKYKVGGEEFITNDKGESVISYADYAVALVDEIKNAQHIKERICVIGI